MDRSERIAAARRAAHGREAETIEDAQEFVDDLVRRIDADIQEYVTDTKEFANHVLDDYNGG